MLTLFKMSWRNLMRHRRRTAISVSAIALGLGLAVLSLSFGEGVYQQLIDDAVRMSGGHFTIEHPEYRDAPAVDLVVDDVDDLKQRLLAIRSVRKAKSLILGQGVLKTGHTAVGGAIIGVEPAEEAGTSPIAKHIVQGRYLADGDEGKVVIGTKMAERLHVDVGKKVVVTTTNAEGDMVESLVRVAGVFEVGASEVDGYLAQLPIGSARALYGLGPGQATQIAALVDTPDHRDVAMAEFRREAPPSVVVLPWESVLEDLSAYVTIDRASNRIIQGIIIFLCLFTILNTILMSVLERTREFAVMLALGAAPRTIKAQILCESTLLAALGTALGLLVGGLVAYYFQVYGVDLRSLSDQEISVSGFTMDPFVHARVTPGILAALGGTIFFATLLISLLAMRRVDNVDPAQVLR